MGEFILIWSFNPLQVQTKRFSDMLYWAFVTSFNPLQVQTKPKGLETWFIVSIWKRFNPLQVQTKLRQKVMIQVICLNVSIPYRYKQNFDTFFAPELLTKVSIPYRYKQNIPNNLLPYVPFGLFQSPIGTNKT